MDSFLGAGQLLLECLARPIAVLVLVLSSDLQNAARKRALLPTISWAAGADAFCSPVIIHLE